MSASLVLRQRTQLADDRFIEIVIWRVPAAVPGSEHGFKYRLVLVVDDVCVLRYDNEAGKGDHKHMGNAEMPYSFSTVEQLLADFRRDVLNWRSK
jgi:hypothetical protein